MTLISRMEPKKSGLLKSTGVMRGKSFAGSNNGKATLLLTGHYTNFGIMSVMAIFQQLRVYFLSTRTTRSRPGAGFPCRYFPRNCSTRNLVVSAARSADSNELIFDRGSREK
jgi:hypothetical protein